MLRKYLQERDWILDYLDVGGYAKPGAVGLLMPTCCVVFPEDEIGETCSDRFL